MASLLIVAAPLGAGWAIARRLPESYYRTRRVESGGRVYEAIGIRVFKRFVPNGDDVNRVIRRADRRYRVVHVPSIVTFEGATRWKDARRQRSPRSDSAGLTDAARRAGQ